MKLELQVRSVYGTQRIYPINETAKKLADLIGRKTFTAADVDKLRAIGFSVAWIPIAVP